MKRIILVEDDVGIQDAVKLILESAGYHIRIFDDGEKILNESYQLPDLYILDKQLNGVDGLELCRHLKKSDTTSHIPVIMLSANPTIVQLAKLAGADLAIEKPFRMSDLRAAAEHFTG